LGADFTGAILTEVDLTAAIYNDLTKWPQGFVPNGAIKQ